MAKILIKNGRIWDGEQFFYGDILTEGSVISQIGESITASANFVYDAEGKIVSPGLVDCHMHMKGISSDNFGIHTEMSCLPFGVTAANDAGGINGNKALLDTFAVKSTVFASAVIKENRLNADAALARLEAYGSRAIGFKLFFDTDSRHIQDITPLQQVCRLAQENGLKVMVHCSGSPTSMLQIIETLSPGDILTHVYHGGENTCMEDGFACLKLAKEKGVVLDAGFAGHVHTDFSIFAAAAASGHLPDTISTDITCCSAYKRGGRYGMTMCMNIARTLGMREEDLFKAITSNPAKALGKENEWGYLKVGRCADISVFDDIDEGFDLTDKAGNHICNTEGYRCVLTVSDGQVVYRN